MIESNEFLGTKQCVLTSGNVTCLHEQKVDKQEYVKHVCFYFSVNVVPSCPCFTRNIKACANYVVLLVSLAFNVFALWDTLFCPMDLVLIQSLQRSEISVLNVQ